MFKISLKKRDVEIPTTVYGKEALLFPEGTVLRLISGGKDSMNDPDDRNKKVIKATGLKHVPFITIDSVKENEIGNKWGTLLNNYTFEFHSSDQEKYKNHVV